MTCADDSATPTQLFSDTTFPTFAMKYWPGVAISAISESPSCEKRYRLYFGKSLLHRSLSVCKRIGRSDATLAETCPEECAAIRAKYLRSRSEAIAAQERATG